jgi:hypothetical protein
MATVTRVSGVEATAGTLYAVNCNLFLLTVKKADGNAIDLRSEDESTNGGIDVYIDGVVEMVLKELNPLAYQVTNSSAGTIHLVMDKNASAADMQTRVRRVGLNPNDDFSTVLGSNSVDISGSTVTAATSLTVA